MLKKEISIIIDSQEQNPLWSQCKRQKLRTGDYSFEYNGKDYSNIVALERKSLIDLFGTLGHGHERFKKELGRALNDLDYFAIVIEGGLRECVEKDFPNAVRIKKMKGTTILNILSTINLKYGIPFFFTGSRYESRLLIKSLFESYVKIMEAKSGTK